MLTHRLKVNMAPSAAPQRVCLSQRDTNARVIVELYSDDGDFVLESGTTAKLGGKRADGVEVPEFNCIVDTSNVTVMFDVPASMTEAPGVGTYDIKLTHSGKDLRSSNIQIYVERAA